MARPVWQQEPQHMLLLVRIILYENFAFMIDRTPQIVSLPTDLYKNFVQVPLPLNSLTHSL